MKKRLDIRTVVKIVAQSKGVEHVAVKRVFNSGQQSWPGLQICLCKQKASKEGENDGDPVAKDNVNIGKDQGIDSDKQEEMPFKQLFIAVKEEASKENFLDKGREYRV